MLLATFVWQHTFKTDFFLPKIIDYELNVLIKIFYKIKNVASNICFAAC